MAFLYSFPSMENFSNFNNSTADIDKKQSASEDAAETERVLWK